MATDWQGKTAVVTAVTGNYDHQGPQRFNDGVDYYFFTDGSVKPVDDEWQIVYLPDFTHINNRRKSKLPKINPGFFRELDQYKYIIWVDGDMQIKSKMFVPEILEHLNSGIVLSPHFDGRDDAYGEARPNKYPGEPVDFQVQQYMEEGFPHAYGLFEAGINARDMSHPLIGNFERTWLLQTMLLSPQDQLSLPYSLWKTGIDFDVLPKSFRDFSWVHLNAHRQDRVKE